MKIFYYQQKEKNFGDDINAWLWTELLPNVWDNDTNTMFCGIGTIIGNWMPKAKSWIVFGSGTAYDPAPKGFGGSDWTVLCVRGPLSAEVLGLPQNKVGTDGALCLSFLPQYAPIPEADRKGIVFMPHHQSIAAGKWKEACELAGIEYLDPREDSQKTVEVIRHARLVIADAMHAAIVADALRVPWVPVATSTQINTFKWLDWTLSMELPYRPFVLNASSRQEAVRNRFSRYLGEGYFLKESSREAAIHHYKILSWLKEKGLWKLSRNAVALVYKAVKYGLVLENRIMSFRKNTTTDPYLESAAESLRKATELTPFLSDQTVYEKKCDEMKCHLERLKSLVKQSQT